jgi:hypothetical protein
MRNDHKGRVRHDETLILDTFFASGKHGKEVRANGEGGKLERGYYARVHNPAYGKAFLVGPFSCRSKAMHTSYKEHKAQVAKARAAPAAPAASTPH